MSGPPTHGVQRSGSKSPRTDTRGGYRRRHQSLGLDHRVARRVLRLLGLAGFAAIDIQFAAGAEILAAGIVAGDRGIEIVVGLVGVDIQLLLLVATAVVNVKRLGQADIAGNVATGVRRDAKAVLDDGAFLGSFPIFYPATRNE